MSSVSPVSFIGQDCRSQTRPGEEDLEAVPVPGVNAERPPQQWIGLVADPDHQELPRL